jgi:class 3 adenylate cyclase
MTCGFLEVTECAFRVMWNADVVLVSLIVVSTCLCIAAGGWAISDLRRRRARREVARLRRALERREQLSLSPRARAMRAVVGTALDAASRMRDEGVGVVVRSSLEGLTRWTAEEQSELAGFAGPDGRVAILFSDIEDSTVLNDQLGDIQWVKILSSHDRLVRSAILEHGGHIVKSQGDGFMIAFSTAADAVRAAVALQTAIDVGDRRLRKRPIHVRVGVHVGTAIERGGDLFGRDVALAARVAAEAVGGEVLTSDAVFKDVSDESDLTFVRAQRVELKGLPGDHQLWSVVVPVA